MRESESIGTGTSGGSAPTRIVDFRTKQSRLRWGVMFAWFVNFAIMVATMEAAVIFTALSSKASNAQIVDFILTTLPFCVVISAVLMLVVSFFSWKTISASSSEAREEVTSGPLYDVVSEVVIASGGTEKDMPKVFVATDVQEPNAYALSGPFGSTITFTDGILRVLNREEIQAVAAHEWGHVLSGDSKAMTKLIAMTSVVGMASGVATRMFRSHNGEGNRNPLAIVLIVVSLLFLMVSPLLSALSSAFMSRKRETNADITAVRLTRNPTALATALEKISGVDPRASQTEESKKFSKAVGALAFFDFGKGLATHPPMDKRIHNLREMGAQA